MTKKTSVSDKLDVIFEPIIDYLITLRNHLQQDALTEEDLAHGVLQDIKKIDQLEQELSVFMLQYHHNSLTRAACNVKLELLINSFQDIDEIDSFNPTARQMITSMKSAKKIFI